MKFTITVLFIGCFLLTKDLFAQASWHYAIWFELADTNGNIINGSDYIDKNIQLLTVPFGAHKNSKLIYDASINKFKFSQQTIATTSALIFVYNNDSTKISISTQNLYIDAIQLTGKSYKINVWDNNEQFIKNYKLPSKYPSEIYTNKLAFKNYNINSVIGKKEYKK